LSKEAIAATLRQVAALAPGSTFAMTFILPMELAEPEERPGREIAEKGARAAGTPFVSFFKPDEMLALAVEAGFKDARHVAAADLEARYFAGRTEACGQEHRSRFWSRRLRAISSGNGSAYARRTPPNLLNLCWPWDALDANRLGFRRLAALPIRTETRAAEKWKTHQIRTPDGGE
jgi:hypothetical protein